jgi:hypothetical protein
VLDGPPAEEPIDPGFVADLRTALAVWRRSPWVPVAGVLLSLVLSLQGMSVDSDGQFAVVSLLTLPVSIVAVAWPGVERLWYLRALRGERLRIREARRFVGAYFWRYAVLGLVVFLPAAIVSFVLLAPDSTAGRVGLVVLVLAIDVALTFVTPALAYTTRRVRVALRVGLDMIVDEWPRCVWYVLAPPLALAVLWQIDVGPARGTGLRMALTVTTPLLGLACKGAIAAFSLRRWPTGPDGAAFSDADVPLPASTRAAVPRRPDRPRGDVGT